MSTPMPSSPPPRLRWADVAKGACILLVVLHHVVSKHLPAVGDGPWVEAWLGLSYALKPVRMPLFFVLSGYFAARALRRPWSPEVRGRVLAPAYLYVVWLLLLFAVFSVERDLPMNRTQDLGDLAGDLVFASTGLWFLYALAVYFLLARLTLRVPLAVLLPAAAGVAMGASLLPVDDANRVSVLVHFVHFLVGARCPELLRRIVDDERPLTFPLLAAYAGGAVVLAMSPAPSSVEVVLLSLVGVPFGLRLAGAVSRRTPAGAVRLAGLGRRTLPVYVMHVPVLAAVHHAVPDLPDGSWLVLYPVVVSAVVVVACLGLHRVMLAVGLRPLFELPRHSRQLERVTVSG